MLEQLESGELERRYSVEQLERITSYIATLAKEGILPGDEGEKEEIEEDCNDLISGEDSAFELISYLEDSYAYTIMPALLYGYSGYDVIQCGKISKAWHKAKKFVKKHKKAIIIGAVVVVAVAAITVAAVAASTAAAGAAMLQHGASDDSSSEDSPSPAIDAFQSTIDEKISSFKESLSQENFFTAGQEGQGLSLEETGRALGPVFAHQSLHDLEGQLPFNAKLSQQMQNMAYHYNLLAPTAAYDNPWAFAHSEIDKSFASPYSSSLSEPPNDTSFPALSYQARAEAARFCGYYSQAVDDFTKAIERNPKDRALYLQRGTSYFAMGAYANSMEDFHVFAKSSCKDAEKIPFSTQEFTIGFAKGLPGGIYESGKGMMLFLAELVRHPIHTATQMYDAVASLAQLVQSEEWQLIAEVLSKEIYTLATDWDSLSSEERGRLSGYAFGKHGADIAAPGALAKLASKSIKSAKDLAAVLKNFQKAEEALILETAAEIGSAAKVEAIITQGQKTTFLAEELGFTPQEMGGLKQAGKLEASITEVYEHLNLSMQESIELFRNAGKLLKKTSGNIYV